MIISLPHGLLAEAAIACAERGLHLLLEKPMGVTVEEADAVIAAARRHGARLMVNFVHRFRAEYRQAKAILDSGAIGRPVLILDSMAAGRGELPGWVWDRRLAGGGMMLYNGIHCVDRLAWLAGSPIARIAGAVSTACYTVELEDNAVASLTFQNGVLGALVQHKSDAPTTLGGWETWIWGTRGAVKVVSGGGLEVASDKERARLEVAADDRFLGAVTEFVAALREGRDPSPSGEDGRHALAAVWALYRAAESGTAQSVPSR